MGNEDFILEMSGIHKGFPGVLALNQVDFQLRRGEIHGLVGENGAGKSTLMKILAGIYSQDSGEIRLEGHVQGRLTTRLVEKLGIHFIHQERQIVPFLTVAESLFLGMEPSFSPFKFINRRQLERQAEAVLKDKLGLNLQGNRLISELTVGEQQLVQICRALLHQPKIIVFDEPTSVLARREADQLFRIIRDLSSKGISMIYISHYLGEVVELCDRITVFRNGARIDTLDTDGLQVEDIVFRMAGRSLEEQFPAKNSQYGDPLLTVKGLTHRSQFRGVSLQVRSGEIVGVTGLMGSGHSELAQSLFDGDGITAGSIEFEGRVISKLRPQKAAAAGIGYMPEDRRRQSIIGTMSVRENITLAGLSGISSLGVIRRKQEQGKVSSLIERLGIRTPGSETAVSNLSGGNQQKVVFAKWLNSGARLYIMNQPTAAVDVGAKAEIYALINSLIRQGAGVLLVTQDLQELAGLSNRIMVMYRGEVIDELDGHNVTADELMVSMMGGRSE
ncbi:sugar ABC transporter ATP-binding protein [Paenibacillus pinihumi]|uniref:sugar ABC transporter ATP-binding protein n=1 Tax=Paenibacillus pinihumi TaxID=669462 RepID=UPI00041F1FC4|nr:sugar ABC transporter ATP-binding protein [Paenibacillus pinihumi]